MASYEEQQEEIYEEQQQTSPYLQELLQQIDDLDFQIAHITYEIDNPSLSHRDRSQLDKQRNLLQVQCSRLKDKLQKQYNPPQPEQSQPQPGPSQPQPGPSQPQPGPSQPQTQLPFFPSNQLMHPSSQPYLPYVSPMHYLSPYAYVPAYSYLPYAPLPVNLQYQGQLFHQPEPRFDQPGYRFQQPGQGSHQSRQGSHQPGQGSHQPGQWSHQPGQGSHQPGQGSHQPGQGSHQPGQGSHQPGQGSHQTGQGSYQPGQGSYQPEQGSHQPGQGSHQQGQWSQPSGQWSQPSGQWSQQSEQWSQPSGQWSQSQQYQFPSSSQGSVGQVSYVYSNMFEIKFYSNFITNASHYNIEITPKTSKTIHRQVFEECRKKHFPDRFPVFDGMSSAYSANNLPFGNNHKYDITLFKNEKNFNITFTKVADIDLSWLKDLRHDTDTTNVNQASVQVFDVIVRHACMSKKYWIAGRSFFTPESQIKSIGIGNLHIGTFISAIPAWKFYLNVDVSHKVFTKRQPVLDIMCGKPSIIKSSEISQLLNGLRISYAVNLQQPDYKRTYCVDKLVNSATKETFTFKENQQITIQQYFTTEKKYTLMYPALPCLGIKGKNIVLPAELCEIVEGQLINKKLKENEVADIIKESAMKPEQRRIEILKAFNMYIEKNTSLTEIMSKEFHFSISNEMKRVEARILPAPEIKYYTKTLNITNGAWHPGKFYKSCDVGNFKWSMFGISGHPDQAPLTDITIFQFEQYFREQASNLGIYFGKCNTATAFRWIYYKNDIIRYLQRLSVDFLIVLITNPRDDAYNTIKQICEMQMGIMTQCIQIKNIQNIMQCHNHRKNSPVLQNILQKINTKLQGINHVLNRTPSCLCDESFMIVGADVTHPTFDTANIPSVVAVTASCDNSAFTYNVTVTVQEPKKEIITHFSQIMYGHFLQYLEKQQKLPSRLFVYRDGVSEGQLEQVINMEVQAIKTAWQSITYQYNRPEKLKITFIIVQKRHHVRLFQDNRDKQNIQHEQYATYKKDNNVRIGTIVDKEITHPNQIEFYLLSHTCPQGTAKPTKYRCIYNENNFNMDQLQELTYHLCHLYARCTKSVSYPVPTYYAHLAAYRGRIWIKNETYIDTDYADFNKCQVTPKLSTMCFV